MAALAKSIAEIVSKIDCRKSARPDRISPECYRFSDTKKTCVIVIIILDVSLPWLFTFCTY